MDQPVSRSRISSKATLGRANGPLYRQLADILRKPIADGHFAVGSELPKEAKIAEHFGVSLITVGRRCANWKSDGLIRKRSAKPAVVTARNPSVNLSWNFKNFADMAAFTKDAQLKVKSYRKEKSAGAAAAFRHGQRRGRLLPAQHPVGGQAEERRRSPPIFRLTSAQSCKREDFTDVLIFRSVQKHARTAPRGGACDGARRDRRRDSRRRSRHGVGNPILTVEMLYQSADQRNIEFSVARHPADLFSITYDAPNDL